MADRLNGKVAVVFGAGQVECAYEMWGNGRATAVAYGREAASVVAVDVDLTAAEATCTFLQEAGHPCLALQADVTQLPEIEAVKDRALAQFGRIDILHNNVGINEKGDPVEASEESWDRVMETNVKSLFLTCKSVLPVMRQQGAGAIINVGSIAGIRGTGHSYISYSTSKAAVSQFTRAIALDNARYGIRANTILPGLMDTPRLYGFGPQYYSSVDALRQQRAANVPLGRMGDAWDVAHAAVFLASDEARYITAVDLSVDGGLAAQVGAGVLERGAQQGVLHEENAPEAGTA